MGGLLLVIFVEPPTKFWVGGDEFSGDWRPTIMALVMLSTYAALVLVEPLREFFELELLGLGDYLFIGGVAAAWTLLLRYSWRINWFERLLGIYDDLSRRDTLDIQV